MVRAIAIWPFMAVVVEHRHGKSADTRNWLIDGAGHAVLANFLQAGLHVLPAAHRADAVGKSMRMHRLPDKTFNFFCR